MDIINPGGTKTVALHGSMLAGSLRICGGRYSCAGLRLPPVLAPEILHLDSSNDGVIHFPMVAGGATQSIQVVVRSCADDLYQLLGVSLVEVEHTQCWPTLDSWAVILLPDWRHTDVQLTNTNSARSAGDMQVSLQELTAEQHTAGWQVQPMEFSIGAGASTTVTVSLQLPDHAREACAGALGYAECFLINLRGTVLDDRASPHKHEEFRLTFRSQPIT